MVVDLPESSVPPRTCLKEVGVLGVRGLGTELAEEVEEEGRGTVARGGLVTTEGLPGFAILVGDLDRLLGEGWGVGVDDLTLFSGVAARPLIALLRVVVRLTSITCR